MAESPPPTSESVTTRLGCPGLPLAGVWRGGAERGNLTPELIG